MISPRKISEEEFDKLQVMSDFRNTLKKILIFPAVLLIKFYQICISPFTPPSSTAPSRDCT